MSFVSPSTPRPVPLHLATKAGLSLKFWSSMSSQGFGSRCSNGCGIAVIKASLPSPQNTNKLAAKLKALHLKARTSPHLNSPRLDSKRPSPHLTSHLAIIKTHGEPALTSKHEQACCKAQNIALEGTNLATPQSTSP